MLCLIARKHRLLSATGASIRQLGVVFLLNPAQTYADTIVELAKAVIIRSNKMGIQDWSDDIILVDLPSEPQIGDELKTLTEIVRDRGDCDVVLDFSSVDIVTSSSLSALLKLRKLLNDCGHNFVFCNVAAATKSIFTVTGIDGVFEFADDKFVALAGLQTVNSQ